MTPGRYFTERQGTQHFVLEHDDGAHSVIHVKPEHGGMVLHIELGASKVLYDLEIHRHSDGDNGRC